MNTDDKVIISTFQINTPERYYTNGKRKNMAITTSSKVLISDIEG